MITMMEAIMNRISIRSYIDKPIAKIQTKQVQRILNSIPPSPFGSKPRFELIDLSELPKRQARHLGGIGTIQGTQLIIAGVIHDTDHHLEDFGFCLEYIVLRLTRLAFGTCWITKNFQREAFARHLHAEKTETLPAIAVLGYFQHKKNLSYQIMKLIAENRQRKAPEQLFFEKSGLTSRKKKEAFREVLEAVRVAPSARNTQPWRIILDGEHHIFHFYLDPEVPGGAETARLDMGIALCHFQLAAGELGLRGYWKTAPEEDRKKRLIYILSWKEGQQEEGESPC